jgi:hypothetical protein
MNRKLALVAFAGLAGAAVVAEAQTLSTMILNDGLFRYSEGVLTATSNRTGTGGGSANFGFANTIATASTVTSDYLFQNWWWFRGPNDTREFGLSRQVQGTQLSPNSAFLRYEEVSGGANVALRFDITYTLNQITPTSAAVTINWSITNLTDSAMPVSFFNYSDFDVLGTGNLYSHFVGPGVEVIRANASAINSAQFATMGADLRLPTRWQVGPFSGTGAPRTALSDTAVTNLNDAMNGTNPGDQAGAFQWDVTIDGGGTVGGRLTKGYNFIVPAPGSLALLGLGGLALARRRR